ncbi:MAG: GlsB/YeaQ/YmgE family stress response membrane protein [Actinomycetota bacterium]|nr:GlsB/YeaQ/YmgE family stress response membrane protein [Actinomycetota bacterium]
MGALILFLVMGLVVGLLARFLLPGRDPMGLLGTLALGVVGSYVGGTLTSVVSGSELTVRPSSFFWSLVGAIVALLVLRAVRR